MVKCKQLARISVWWPYLDRDVENFIGNCVACQTYATSRSNVGTVSWPRTNFPMERLHIDHFFFEGKSFLLIVDDFSNYIDVKLNKSVDSKSVIISLREFFSLFGLPETIVSDNATSFNSLEFRNFCSFNAIKHVNSPQYHPQSNGLAERSVGVVKSSLKKCLSQSRLELEKQIIDFLYDYRFSPLCGDSESPAEKIFKFRPRNNFTHLLKQVPTARCSNQGKSLTCETKNTENTSSWMPAKPSMPEFTTGSPVYYYFKIKKVWVEGVVVRKVSNLIYEIKLKSGSSLKAHLSCLKSRERKELTGDLYSEEKIETGMVLRPRRFIKYF